MFVCRRHVRRGVKYKGFFKMEHGDVIVNRNGRIAITMTRRPAGLLRRYPLIRVFVDDEGRAETWNATRVEIVGDVRPMSLPFRFLGKTMFVYVSGDLHSSMRL